MVRNTHETSGAIGATDPLAMVGRLSPNGVTPASGGGPSFNIVIPDDKIKITKGRTSALNLTADSGNSLERHFCSNCGTAIYTKLSTRTVWKAGLFNHVKDLALAANVWSSSANNLIEVNTEVKTFEKGAS